MRIRSVDLMRGLVILLMAIDHARDFFSPTGFDPTDLSQASPELFLTRWITHFCAPTFVFLAGSSAFLQRSASGMTRNQLQGFLLKRGAWLVLLELTLVSFSWRFDFGGATLQVIWAIGWSMAFLALLLFLPEPAILVIGAAIVVLHNSLDSLPVGAFLSGHPALAWLWAVLHEPRAGPAGASYRIVVLYPLIPWIGVFALGYCFGRLLTLQEPIRIPWMRCLGGGALFLFLSLRLGNIYGDPHAWARSPRGPLVTVLEFLNTTKYPPSLQYLLMTSGPVLLILSGLESWRGRVAEFVRVFGRVPLFFYLIHIPLLHLVAVVAARLMYGASPAAFVGRFPENYEPSLVRVYVAWIALVAGTYPLCRWYAGYKSRHRGQAWLSYF